MIREYGSQYINPHRLMKLCARTILLRLFDQDDLLLHMAYKVFQAGAYDSVIMDYLCEHFNGTVSQMYEVLIQGVREHVETYDLEERLLCQMLFTAAVSRWTLCLSFMEPETHQGDYCKSILYPEVRPVFRGMP